MKKIYFDTNIFIYFIEVYNINEKSFLEKIISSNQIVTSELTIAECFGNENTKEEYRELIFDKKILVKKVDREVLEKSAEIKNNYNLKLPDAIHAATAILNGCDVIYTNDKDFKKVENINIPVLHDISRSIHSIKETLKLEILNFNDIQQQLNL